MSTITVKIVRSEYLQIGKEKASSDYSLASMKNKPVVVAPKNLQ